MQTVNERLALLPDLLGFDSPAGMAKAAGIDPNTLRKAMQGPSKPSFDTLEAITTRWPKLSASWLLSGKGEPFGTAAYVAAPTSKVEEPAPRLSHAAPAEVAALKEQLEDALTGEEAWRNEAATWKRLYLSSIGFKEEEPAGKSTDNESAAGPYRAPGFEFGRGSQSAPRPMSSARVADGSWLLVPTTAADPFVIVEDQRDEEAA